MTAAAEAMPAVAGPARWEPVTAQAPRLGATMLTYLDQLAVSQRPGTIQSTDTPRCGCSPASCLTTTLGCGPSDR